jgi:enoyl-CoA hydratase
MAVNAPPIDKGDSVAGIFLEQEDGVAWVTLSNPGRLNAINVAMWRELHSVFTRLSDDLSLRCIVVRGDNGNFAAGADIREFPRERADLVSVMHYHNQILAPALQAVQRCIHPVVAEIQGVCVGGGLELASMCDLRIAAESARFGVPINRLGFPMAPGEMQGLLALAGRSVTMEILLEGRVFDAHEAYEKRLLTRVLPDAELSAHVASVVDKLANGAPLAARINKTTARRLTADARPLDEAELQACFSYAESHDHREGVRAFLAGERAIFTGA